ncbi:helix-turn-helix domain-containing protein [Trinickia acidisoli]|uniref:helix-turn-helix domain-containing protein n=1 Tax=Trinickia acidisoli TaxID=2767482 RepID=UPI001A8E08A0|nr:AraC family transcriptional regulator [Trinickia acidisoli]
MRRTEGLDQARAFIEAHFDEPLTLQQMAAPAALSISRFATAFRERFGSSPYRYLCGLRIKRAQSLLLAGVPSIAVATEVGFFDQSHFGRHFKRFCGMTPTGFVASALAKHGMATNLGQRNIGDDMPSIRSSSVERVQRKHGSIR